MGGKSTLLRQVLLCCPALRTRGGTHCCASSALIGRLACSGQRNLCWLAAGSELAQVCLAALLAQVGAMVPAESLELTPVDAIFVRSGARDAILSGQVRASVLSSLWRHCWPQITRAAQPFSQPVLVTWAALASRWTCCRAVSARADRAARLSPCVGWPQRRGPCHASSGLPPADMEAAVRAVHLLCGAGGDCSRAAEGHARQPGRAGRAGQGHRHGGRGRHCSRRAAAPGRHRRLQARGRTSARGTALRAIRAAGLLHFAHGTRPARKHSSIAGLQPAAGRPVLGAGSACVAPAAALPAAPR